MWKLEMHGRTECNVVQHGTVHFRVEYALILVLVIHIYTICYTDYKRITQHPSFTSDMYIDMIFSRER